MNQTNIYQKPQLIQTQIGELQSIKRKNSTKQQKNINKSWPKKTQIQPLTSISIKRYN